MPLTQQPAAAKSYSLFAVASVIRWTHEFASSATVHCVLLWAIGKCVFNLDDTAKAKANFLLPGTEQPLPTDSVIGSFVKHGDCQLALEPTLKDFTNG